jgi:hypothetical protein
MEKIYDFNGIISPSETHIARKGLGSYTRGNPNYNNNLIELTNEEYAIVSTENGKVGVSGTLLQSSSVLFCKVKLDTSNVNSIKLQYILENDGLGAVYNILEWDGKNWTQHFSINKTINNGVMQETELVNNVQDDNYLTFAISVRNITFPYTNYFYGIRLIVEE